MTTLFENKAWLRKERSGFPKTVKATLCDDHIELHDKKGDILLNAPLSGLANSELRPNVISFTSGAQNYFIDFSSWGQKLGVGFGAVGALIGMNAGSGKKIAKDWALAMQQKGVQFKKEVI